MGTYCTLSSILSLRLLLIITFANSYWSVHPLSTDIRSFTHPIRASSPHLPGLTTVHRFSEERRSELVYDSSLGPLSTHRPVSFLSRHQDAIERNRALNASAYSITARVPSVRLLCEHLQERALGFSSSTPNKERMKLMDRDERTQG